MKPAIAMLSAAVLLAGCSGALRKPPAVPEAQQPARKVALRIHAAQRLNTDGRGQPLALVARIYKLRQSAAFERMPYSAFLQPEAERQALGADLVEVKEITLVPGQHYEVTESVPREAGYVGVVALFHAPAAQRWRLAFAAADAEQHGVTVGAFACALAAGAGAQPASREPAMQSSVRCQ